MKAFFWLEFLGVFLSASQAHAVVGWVGIGVSSPVAAPLQIQSTDQYVGGIQINSTTYSGSKRANIGFGGSAGGSYYVIGTDYAANGTRDFYLYDNTSSAMRMYVSSAGNVGFGGTTSPTVAMELSSGLLQVDGDMGRFKGWAATGATGRGAEIGISGGIGYLLNYDRGAGTYGDFSINNTMTVQGNNGRVGIGINSPTYKFEVANPGGGASWAARVDSGDGNTLVYMSHPSYGVYSYTAAASSYSLYGDSYGTGSFGTLGYNRHFNGFGALFQNTATGPYCYIGYPNGYSLVCSGSTVGISDVRLKKDIRPLKSKDGLEAVMALKPVRFHWRNENRNVAGKDSIGFIAQDVEKVIPDLIHEATSKAEKTADPTLDVGDTIKALDYESIIPVLVKAAQDLRAHNVALRERNKRLFAALASRCHQDPTAPFCK